MQRLFLLSILSLAFSFACDQPHEEIHGIKIGCPVDRAVNDQHYIQGDPLLGGNFIYRDIEATELFNLEGLIIVEGNIEGLVLRENSRFISFDDFIEYVKSMEASWGSAMLSEDSEVHIAHFNQIPSKSIVNYVDAILAKKDGSLLITYRTINLQEAQKREEEKVRRWSAEGIWRNAAKDNEQ